MITHYLTEGDVIDLNRWSVTSFAEYKEDVSGRESHDDTSTSEDVFGRNPDDLEGPGEWARIAEYITDS